MSKRKKFVFTRNVETMQLEDVYNGRPDNIANKCFPQYFKSEKCGIMDEVGLKTTEWRKIEGIPVCDKAKDLYYKNDPWFMDEILPILKEYIVKGVDIHK
tara:strand:+ start:1833 stop:2132 length:300 start_codon:yes stop_codon:yes gene_type:complete